MKTPVKRILKSFFLLIQGLQLSLVESSIRNPKGKPLMIKSAKTPKKPKRITLLDRTRELLIHRPRTVTIAMIAAEVGCSESALDSLISGRVREPSVNLIQKLYEFLSGSELQY